MRKISILLSLFCFAFACTSENAEDLGPCNTADVSYQNELQAIFKANCTNVGCHGGPNGVANLDLNTYASTKRIADDGSLVDRITGVGNLMPPGGALPDCEIDKIRSWVLDGARNR